MFYFKSTRAPTVDLCSAESEMGEKVKEKVIQLKYLNTQVLPADFGTKAHTPKEHSRKVERIMGTPGKQNEIRI